MFLFPLPRPPKYWDFQRVPLGLAGNVSFWKVNSLKMPQTRHYNWVSSRLSRHPLLTLIESDSRLGGYVPGWSKPYSLDREAGLAISTILLLLGIWCAGGWSSDTLNQRMKPGQWPWTRFGVVLFLCSVIRCCSWWQTGTSLLTSFSLLHFYVLFLST